MSMINDIRAELTTVRPSRGQVLTLGFIFLAVALFVVWRWVGFETILAWVLIGAPLIFLILALIHHRRLIPIYRGWMLLALILGWVVLRLLLVLSFVFLIVPIGLILRVSGNDLMGRAPSKSHWHAVQSAHRGITRYRKKF